MTLVNHSLPRPVKGWVEAHFLGLSGKPVPASIVAVSTYEGEAMALTALLGGDGPENGSLFAYLPFDAFSTKPDTSLIPYQELVWEACRGGAVDISVLTALPERVSCLRRRDKGTEPAWEKGAYMMTFDWTEANRMLHLVLLDQGQFMVTPNHKMKWGDAPLVLAPIHKMRETWLVK